MMSWFRHWQNNEQRATDLSKTAGPVKPEKEITMLWTIVVILLILWVLGLVSSYTLGGMIHLLLVIAVIIIVVNLIQGRRSL